MTDPVPPAQSIARHPVIVVAIPTHNEERYIAEAIRSLQHQTWSDFLAVISDNASTDRTEEICRREIAGDPRFQFVRHGRNMGAAHNFNFVLESSDSPYFMWLGAHDMIAPEFLRDHLEALEADRELSLSYSLTQWIDEAGKPLRVTDSDRLDALQGGPLLRYVKSIPKLEECTAINNPFRRSALGEERCSSVPSCDHIILSELLASGPANLVAKPQYCRRTFEHEQESYMQRLTGQPTARRDTSQTIIHYVASFDRVAAGQPSRWVLRPLVVLLVSWKFRSWARGLRSRLFGKGRRR